ncbi:uncharacterized protein E0L32_010564 [Thyridium curvatum]|uniref:Major facilitator superfamily (MFS) profile domain-containing protein n=1 Tax=Thyridium curvatum TaxID=1093900 RepID=A0A507AG97_9PEZI|nr:uncharacterized protein E0L32_010564 [Thyridium curvatum]TPX07772.1 hypothetical protein E0L32_010564 [Thyridium curvatum]
MGGIFQKTHLSGAFNGRLLFCCSLMMLSQINYGLDQIAYSTTQAMTPFENKFGVYSPARKRKVIEPYFLSLLNSLPTVGQVIGVAFGSYICRQWGRRMSFWVMCVWAWVAAILAVTAQHREQVLVARVINFLYIGMELATIPVAQAEFVPSNVRGFVVGTYQLGLMMGALIMSCVCLGTSKIKGDNAWRIPYGLFFIVPTIVFVGTFYIPESPRWLLIKGRTTEARENLAMIRRGKFTEQQIDEEFAALQAGLEVSVEKGSFKEIWQGKNRSRTLMTIGVNFFLQVRTSSEPCCHALMPHQAALDPRANDRYYVQATGQAFSSQYGAIFVKDIGAIDPFVMKTVNQLINLFTILACMYLTDISGRKALLNVGAFLQFGSLMAMGGLGTPASPTKSMKIGITAMTTIFGAGFCLGWAPVSHVVAAELPTNRLRDVTYATGNVVQIIILFAVNFSIPYLLYEPYAALGSKVGFIFGSFAALAILFTWLCLPECKGFSLEEIDYLFNADVPVRKFSHFKHGEIIPTEGNLTKEKSVQIEQREV